MPNINDAIRMLTEAGKADARGDFLEARERYLAAKKSLEAAEASPARDMSLITCLLHLAAAEVALDSSRSPMPLVEDALRLAHATGRELLAGRGLTVVAGRQVRAGLFQAARQTLALSQELLLGSDADDAVQGIAWNLVLEAQMQLIEGDPLEALSSAEAALDMLSQDDDEAPVRLAASEVLRKAEKALDADSAPSHAPPRRRANRGNGNGNGRRRG